MPKSLYLNETFADYWNERAGEAGEAYKQYVLDPLMFKLVGNFKAKTVLELGCGNGYLASKLLKRSPKQIIMVDISDYNLRHAAAKCNDPRVTFLQQDVTEPWGIEDASVDIIYSNMMLNEVDDIETPIKEAFRVLCSGGAFVFSVTHPAWDLYMFAQEKAGKPSKKVIGLGGYFRRGPAKFLMGGGRGSKAFEVDHYQRPLADYFEQLVAAGFTVNHLLEPEMTDVLLRNNPRFAEYADNPIGLIFYCTKS